MADFNVRTVKQLLRIVIFFSFIFFTVSCFFSTIASRYAYFRYYDFVPGQYHGYRLSQLTEANAQQTCLVLGASTAREAFDIALLNNIAPEINFVSLATSATGPGAVALLDLQSRALPSYSFHCIVVAMHPFFLSPVGEDSYDLEGTDYVSQLSFPDLIDVLFTDGLPSLEGIKLLISVAFVPNFQHAGIIGKHLIHLMRAAHSKFVSPSSENSYLERFADYASPNGHIRYEDDRKENMDRFIEARIERINNSNRAQPSEYRSVVSKEIFLELLDRLSSRTDRLIILDLPETYVYGGMVQASLPFFNEILSSSTAPIEVYSCAYNFIDPVRGFVDTIHPDSEGRRLLTESIVRILNPEDYSETFAQVCL